MSSATELQAWLNGVADGGPESDGRYPLTYADGLTYLVYCPAAQALNPALAEQPIEVFSNTAANAAATATVEAAEAEQSSIDAQTYAANALAHATAANASKVAALASETDAESAATAAGTSADAALVSETAAAASATAADSSADAAAASATAADASADAAAASAASAASVLTTTITNGDTTHAPDGNAVFDAMALKVDKGTAFADTYTVTTLYYNGTSTIIDCDTLANGTRVLVAVGNSNTNTPPSVNGTTIWYIETIQPYVAVTRMQRAFSYNGTGKIAIRSSVDSGDTWTDWGVFDDAALVHTTDLSTASVANSVAKRDASGDLTARLVRSDFADGAAMSGAIAYRVNNTTDNYTRFCSSPTPVRTWLGLGTMALEASANYALKASPTFTGTVTLSTLQFATGLGQHINLYSTTFGIGIQNSTMYERAGAGGGFAWFIGGVHSATAKDPGAGGLLGASLSSAGHFDAVTIGVGAGSTSYFFKPATNDMGLMGDFRVRGTTYSLWANAAGWVRNPRIFVGGADPGATAADGDIWIP